MSVDANGVRQTAVSRQIPIKKNTFLVRNLGLCTAASTENDPVVTLPKPEKPLALLEYREESSIRPHTLDHQAAYCSSISKRISEDITATDVEEHEQRNREKGSPKTVQSATKILRQFKNRAALFDLSNLSFKIETPAASAVKSRQNA